MSNTGNINYSLNKNDFYKIIVKNSLNFIPHYLLLIIFAFIYIFSIRYKQYFFIDRYPKYQKEEKIYHYFKSITLNSPFNTLSLSESNKDGNKFVGLSNTSYIIVILTYVFTFIILLEGLIRNYIYSIFVNVIQTNPNNNPYNNPNCITKINESAYVSVSKNYSTIITLSLIFLIPFFILFFINYFKLDNYDIKHNKWIAFFILILLFSPFIILLLLRVSFSKRLSIFSGLDVFLDKTDTDIVTFIKNNFNFKIYSLIIFLFIVFVYIIYNLMYIDYKYSGSTKVKIYLLFVFILFIFIPIFIIFFVLSFIFDNKYKKESNDGDDIDNIEKNGVNSLYDLLIKYNYPCFMK